MFLKKFLIGTEFYIGLIVTQLSEKPDLIETYNWALSYAHLKDQFI